MKVLVVEDELFTLEEIAGCVQSYNKKWMCDTASNSLAAIEKCEKTKYDLALLDIQMPQKNGYELAMELQKSNPKMSTIFITAYNNYASEAFDVNASDYILKPVRSERLNKALEKIEQKCCTELKSLETSGHVFINSFGKLIVGTNDNVLKWKRQRASEIFAYLLHNKGVPVHKDKLCELIWPGSEPQKALVNLQSVIYELRKCLEKNCNNQIKIKYLNHCYLLQLEEVEYDAEKFLDTYEKAFEQNPPSKEYLLKAESYYKGLYFEEESWIWSLPTQQTLNIKYQRILKALIKLEMQSNNKEQVIVYLKKLLGNDEYSDDSYLTWIKKHMKA